MGPDEGNGTCCTFSLLFQLEANCALSSFHMLCCCELYHSHYTTIHTYTYNMMTEHAIYTHSPSTCISLLISRFSILIRPCLFLVTCEVCVAPCVASPDGCSTAYTQLCSLYIQWLTLTYSYPPTGTPNKTTPCTAIMQQWPATCMYLNYVTAQGFVVDPRSTANYCDHSVSRCSKPLLQTQFVMIKAHMAPS